MKIILSPQAAFEDDALPIINGDSVEYRGVTFNVKDEELPEFARYEGDTLTIDYRYDSNTAIPEQSLDWADYTFEADDIHCPIVRYENPLP